MSLLSGVQARFMKNRTAKTTTITTTMASTIVVSAIGILPNGAIQSSKAGRQQRSSGYSRDVNERHTNTDGIPEVTTTAGLTSLARPRRAKGASHTFGRYGENRIRFRHHPVPFKCSAAVNLRSRCGSLRCRPVTSSQRTPGGAPQVGQRIASTF